MIEFQINDNSWNGNRLMICYAIQIVQSIFSITKYVFDNIEGAFQFSLNIHSLNVGKIDVSIIH